MFGIVSQQGSAPREDVEHALISHAIEDCAVLPAGLDKPAPAQAREVIGHP